MPLTILLNVLGERVLTTPLWTWLAFGAITASAWLVWHVRWRQAYQVGRAA